MKDIYVATMSGGMDSAWMVYRWLFEGKRLDEIIMCDAPEFEAMHIYQDRWCQFLRERFGVDVVRLNKGNGKNTFNMWMYGKYTRGDLEGRVRGFPSATRMDYCTRELKVTPYNKYIKEKYGDDVSIIRIDGICKDEPGRIGQAVYPLVEWGLTGADCRIQMEQIGMLNPLYKYYDRTGCWLCPKQGVKGFLTLYRYFPEKWEELRSIGRRLVDMDAWQIEILPGECKGGPGYTVEQLHRKFVKMDIFKNKVDKKRIEFESKQMMLFE